VLLGGLLAGSLAWSLGQAIVTLVQTPLPARAVASVVHAAS
jgi:hypothetical protein